MPVCVLKNVNSSASLTCVCINLFNCLLVSLVFTTYIVEETRNRVSSKTQLKRQLLTDIWSLPARIPEESYKFLLIFTSGFYYFLIILSILSRKTKVYHAAL